MDDPVETSKQTKIKHSILSEDGRLKYNFMISLQKISMARIVSNLWMNQHIQERIQDLYQQHGCMSPSSFSDIEQDICDKISHFSLPNSISQELTYLISVLRDSICNWITYHDEHIFSTHESGYSAVHLIHNIAWTARGKIDHRQTAINILGSCKREDNGLCLDHKYKLACAYCLEEEIALLSSDIKLVYGTVGKFYLPGIMIDKHPLVYFWTAHIFGDLTLLNNPPYYSIGNQPYGDISINEHIMHLLIKSYGRICETVNEVPITFLWNKLSMEEKDKNIALLFKNVYNSDFIISLLSNLDYDQQQNILKGCSDAVLGAILNDWLWWGKYFLPTALNALDVMDPSSFLKVLCKLYTISGKNMCDHFKYLINLLWQASSMQLKENIFHNEFWHLQKFVISQLSWERDLDIIEIILKDLNMRQKKNIAFAGIHQCASFIKLDKWDLVDSFIKSTLSSEEDVRQLKKRIVEYKGKDLAVHFLNRREFLKLENFMNWAFTSEDEITNFRQRFRFSIPSLAQ